MICDEPGCTGIHDHRRRQAEWCPRTRRRAAAVRDAWKNAHPGRDYLQTLHNARRRRGTA